MSLTTSGWGEGGWVGEDRLLFQYLGFRVLLQPFFPSGDFVGNLGEHPFEIFPLDCHQAIFVRVPEASRLSVVQNESSFIGPARRNQGQGLTIDLAAVHSRQVDQGSVTHGHRVITYIAV